jgi:hypothetical protein
MSGHAITPCYEIASGAIPQFVQLHASILVGRCLPVIFTATLSAVRGRELSGSQSHKFICAGDEPLAPLRRELDPPTPIFSFCKLSNFSDIMLPNTIEGDVFLRAPDKRAFRPKSRAGACQ